MRLMAPEIMHTLKHKLIYVAFPPTGFPKPLPLSSANRKPLSDYLIKSIQSAHKYIFDSGADRDTETTEAIHNTAEAMIDMGLFHCPFQALWIEDPFEGFEDTRRNFYLIEEEPGTTLISIRYCTVTDESNPINKKEPLFVVFPPIQFSLTEREPDFIFRVPGGTDPAVTHKLERKLAEAVYSFKKFIVTLNTVNYVQDLVLAHAEKKAWDGNPKSKPYTHTIVRVPRDTQDGRVGTSRANGYVPYKKLIAGYVYGKNTRARDQQRWIAPYWRGKGEAETAQRTHHEVR